MLILLTSRFLSFLYRGECAALDPELALISSVPRDSAALEPTLKVLLRVCEGLTLKWHRQAGK